VSSQGPAATSEVAVVVLAGGTSRRFGSDKLAAPLGDTTVLDVLVGSLPPGWPVLVVGPRRPLVREVGWVREDPPGGGPLAGVAAALAVLRSAVVAVVAGDMPYAGPAVATLVSTLLTAPPEVGAVIAVDGTGVPNPLLAAYRTAEAFAVLPPSAAGRPARLLLEVAHIEITFTDDVVRDIDSPGDLPGRE